MNFKKNFGDVYFDFNSPYTLDDIELTNHFKLVNDTFAWEQVDYITFNWSSVGMDKANLELDAGNENHYTGKVNMSIIWTRLYLEDNDVPLMYMEFKGSEFIGLTDIYGGLEAKYDTLKIVNCLSVNTLLSDGTTAKFFKTNGYGAIRYINFSSEVKSINDSFSSIYSTLQGIIFTNIATVGGNSFVHLANLNYLLLGSNENLTLSNEAFQDNYHLDYIVGNFSSEPISRNISAAFLGCGRDAENRKIENKNLSYPNSNFVAYLKTVYPALSNYS